MYLRKHGSWEIWESCHPASVGCASEGREQCHCKYHLVNEERTVILSFETWEEAEREFMARSGAPTLISTLIHKPA